MKKETLIDISKIAIIAALYVVLTLISFPLSFGYVQFRVAEILMILCIYDKKYIYAVVIGCMIANFFSFNMMDVIFGSFATLLSGIVMYLIRNRLIASVIPAIFNGLIIGVEIHLLLGINLLYSVFFIIIGEMLVVTIFGNIIFSLVEKNKILMEKINENK